jgi:hypothetical protein
MMDGLEPACLRQGPALGVGNRNDWHRGEIIEHRLVLRQVEAAMHGGDEGRGLAREHRERKIIEVEMQHVEFGGTLSHLFQHGHMQRHRIAHRIVQAQRTRPHRLELGRGLRIAAGEQRDVVAKRHQLLGEPGNHSLGSAIQFRGNRLGQRCNLRNTHENCLL